MRWWNLLRSGRIGQLISDGRLALLLLRDPRVPLWTKAVALGVALYILSPLDLIPDFIPVLGELDDVAVLLFGIELLIQLSPPHVVAEHRASLGQSV